MAYPVTKETFARRNVGDTLSVDDKNIPADFMERLQDVLGLDITGTFVDLALRLNAIEDQIVSGGTVFHNVNVYTDTGQTSWASLDLSAQIGSGQKVVLLEVFSSYPGFLQVFFRATGSPVSNVFGSSNLGSVVLTLNAWKNVIIYTDNVGSIDHIWSATSPGCKIDLVASW